MESDIRYVNATKAARLILLEIGLLPTAATAKLFGKLAFIVLETLHSCDQELIDSRERAWLCPHCLRRLPPGSMEGGMKPPCPCCGKRLTQPEIVTTN
jgi:hypothetical protein